MQKGSWWGAEEASGSGRVEEGPGPSPEWGEAASRSECGAHLVRHGSCEGDVRFQEQTVAASQGHRGPSSEAWCTWQRRGGWCIRCLPSESGKVFRCSWDVWGQRGESSGRLHACVGAGRPGKTVGSHAFALVQSVQKMPGPPMRPTPGSPLPPPALPPLGPLCLLCFHVLPLLSACKVSVMPYF